MSECPSCGAEVEANSRGQQLGVPYRCGAGMHDPNWHSAAYRCECGCRWVEEFLAACGGCGFGGEMRWPRTVLN